MSNDLAGWIMNTFWGWTVFTFQLLFQAARFIIALVSRLLNERQKQAPPTQASLFDRTQE